MNLSVKSLKKQINQVGIFKKYRHIYDGKLCAGHIYNTIFFYSHYAFKFHNSKLFLFLIFKLKIYPQFKIIMTVIQ